MLKLILLTAISVITLSTVFVYAICKGLGKITNIDDPLDDKNIR